LTAVQRLLPIHRAHPSEQPGQQPDERAGPSRGVLADANARQAQQHHRQHDEARADDNIEGAPVDADQQVNPGQSAQN
jgi:hypothetical protein